MKMKLARALRKNLGVVDVNKNNNNFQSILKLKEEDHEEFILNDLNRFQVNEYTD